MHPSSLSEDQCEQWKLWARSASRQTSHDNLITCYPDRRSALHMTLLDETEELSFTYGDSDGSDSDEDSDDEAVIDCLFRAVRARRHSAHCHRHHYSSTASSSPRETHHHHRFPSRNIPSSREPLKHGTTPTKVQNRAERDTIEVAGTMPDLDASSSRKRIGPEAGAGPVVSSGDRLRHNRAIAAVGRLPPPATPAARMLRRESTWRLIEKMEALGGGRKVPAMRDTGVAVPRAQEDSAYGLRDDEGDSGLNGAAAGIAASSQQVTVSGQQQQSQPPPPRPPPRANTAIAVSRLLRRRHRHRRPSPLAGTAMTGI
jgi:hypothetical protein